ncbi:MAG: FkbM family methyltransferase [Candidatus Azotimanducaceae bacterium]|jgi:FkbM family methyltransferase
MSIYGTAIAAEILMHFGIISKTFKIILMGKLGIAFLSTQESFMDHLQQKLQDYTLGKIDKENYIISNYDEHHSHLFEYSDYLLHTNISKITIEDNGVVFTFRDSGIMMMCPPGDHRVAPIETLNFLDYEKDESWMIERLVNNGDTIFDIGANMGYYSVLLAKKNIDASVHCFEPIPTTFGLCQKNISLNELANINCNNFGLSDKDGYFPFYFYPEGSGNASAVNVSGRSEVEEISCRLKTLDGYVDEKNVNIDFIKCDVEGAELFAFIGGSKTIGRDKPIVFAEILRKYCLKYNYDHNDIFQWFYDLGYRAFTVHDKKLLPFHLMDQDTIQTNFFFLHTAKHDSIISALELV